MLQSTTKRGFSLIEVIVGLAIMIMIAAVVTPVLLGTLDRARLGQARETLDGFHVSLQAFRDDVQHYPGDLTHLVEQIETSEQNSCGDNYTSFPPPANEIARWQGPYTSRIIQPSGVPLPIGTLETPLSRIDTGGGNAQLRLVVTSVTQEDAEGLNRMVDADGSSTGGVVQWTTPADAQGFVTLFYGMAISGC